MRQDSCKSKVDLLFIIDESGSMQAAGYQQCLDFAQKVVGDFDVGQSADQTRVASISFGKTTNVRVSISGVLLLNTHAQSTFTLLLSISTNAALSSKCI